LEFAVDCADSKFEVVADHHTIDGRELMFWDDDDGWVASFWLPNVLRWFCEDDDVEEEEER